MTDLSPWAGKELELYKDSQEWNPSIWEETKTNEFSRSVTIVYPSQLRFGLKKLAAEGWVDTDAEFWSYSLAFAAARKKSYMEQVPYQIVEVINHA